MRTMRIVGIVALSVAMVGCYRATHLTRERIVERDADGKIVKTIEREMVVQEIPAEGITPEMLQGIRLKKSPHSPPAEERRPEDR